MQRFGGQDARQAISAAAQREADRVADLRRAVRGKRGEASDSDEDVDEALDLGAGTVADRAKRLVAAEQEKTGELPQKGLFGMKFMRDAISRKKEEADKQASEIIGEIDQMEGAAESD